MFKHWAEFSQQERPLKCSYFIQPTYTFLLEAWLSLSNNFRELLNISLMNTALSNGLFKLETCM